ncbi:Hint domain-containing protein [Actibacterium ureilyticum]|uniref:Hint domain-containing protein n=1 Tax=Actibacterium ureilyticum TaxID=1590614 RepID=UPI000BAB077B|nr:Hint domain-containing protein [Actibacterium ureilyticum]
MEASFAGTFVIPWSQTETDGVSGAPAEVLTVGSGWRWFGQMTRLDGPNSVLRLGPGGSTGELRRRAARSVQRIMRQVPRDCATATPAPQDEPQGERGFVVTDGIRSFTVTRIPAGQGRAPLLLFVDEVPPKGRDLWVVRLLGDPRAEVDRVEMPRGVICFTEGTLIDTPQGRRPVETLHEGDALLTRDAGAQPILWTGRRRMSGARLRAMAHLRPVRIRAGALDSERPQQDLIVSPQHRVLIRGGAAEMLFQTPEVLVAAEDLVNNRSIVVDHGLHEVTYIHLMLAQHHIVWANGVETESFHPGAADLDQMSAEQRDRLLAFFPSLAQDPDAYGGYARRMLNRGEAAILQHKVAQQH